MTSFRYRTATLVGPWRATFDTAVEDAIRSKQARREEDGGAWHWVVPGAIEDREDHSGGALYDSRTRHRV